jgi:hypothetical protein
MRVPGTKRKRDGATEQVRTSVLAARDYRDTFLRVGVVAVGALALTAGSAAIFALRQRMEASP